MWARKAVVIVATERKERRRRLECGLKPLRKAGQAGCPAEARLSTGPKISSRTTV